MQRRVIIIGILALLLLAACGQPGVESQATAGETVTAFVGDLAASASAGGRVLPRRTAALAVETPGRVETVFIRVGDTVAEDDPLVQLETEDLTLTVASARQDLAMQEANLLDLQTPATEEEIAAAEAAVANAQAQLDLLVAGPRPEEVAAAEANVRAAEAGIWSSSEQLDQVQNSVEEAQVATARANLAAAQLELEQAQRVNEDEPNVTTHEALVDAQEAVTVAQAKLDDLLAGPNVDAVAAARSDVGAAAADRDAQQADLDQLVAGSSNAQIAGAESSLAQAEAALDALQSGPTEEELAVAQAQVAQASLAVADAEADLAAATLRAPFAGTVTAVHVSEGEFASGVAVELMDRESLWVVLTVDEADVGSLATGQPAFVTLEAWPETEIESEIVRIAPAPNAGDSALVSYEVGLDLTQTELPVRAGMTANARLVTARRDDVVLVPNRAIIADREAGTYFVDLVLGEGESERIERIEVSIGLRDDDNTQIVDGLDAGDRVRIGAVRADNPFGTPGPGGGPPAGG